ELVRNLLRYLLAIALATHAQVRADRTDPALLELVRTMRRRDLGERERVRLLRLLVRPLTSRRGAHPLPELVDLVTTQPDGTDGLDPILALHSTTDHAGSEDVVRSRLGRLIPELTQLLRRATFVLDYVLVVPRNHAAERWAGLRRQHRALATVFDGELVKDHPMLLDREGRICVDLWPLMQTVSPTEGAEPELFLFDGRGRHGALLVAAPTNFEHHDPGVWEWIAARVIAEVDANPELAGDDLPPYLGLTSYATSDAGRFVGRESEVDAFLNRLRQRPLQVVVGPSGAGKSSFVHAGVVPGLPSSWRTVTVRPGGSPLTALASRLAAANVTSSDLRPLLETSPAAAAVLVAQAALSGTIVIVIDQLEELFTLCTSTEERVQFAAVIAQLAGSADAPIRVICAIRDDFLMQLDALAPLRPLLSPALVLLGNPSRDTLVRIVVEPARRAGYALSDPELAQDMVSAVADRPGALALLSFTASRLWELRDRRFRQLTRKAYDAMGGIGGALGRHAEATLEKLSADEQRLAREIFRHLVTADGTRAPLSMDELRQRLANPRADAAIDKLVSARLITISEVDGEPNVEVIHDSLVGAWPRLQGWIREDVDGARMRDQIRAAARQWDERGRPRGLVWRDEVLLDLERWLHREAGVALSDRETAFVDASRRFAAGAKRVRRVLYVTAFVVAILFAAFQFRAARQTREAQVRAEELLTDSYIEAGRRDLLDQKFAEAAAYFEHAMARGRHTPNLEMSFALATKPLAAQRLRLSSLPDLITTVRFSADGNRIITTDDKNVRVWSADTGELLMKLPHKDAQEAEILPSGAVLATAGGDGFVRTWDLTSGHPLLTLSQAHVPADEHRVQFWHVAASPDGTRIAAIDRAGAQVDVWDVTTGELVRELVLDLVGPFRPEIAFTTDGRWLLATAGTDLQAFDTQTWNPIKIPAGAVRSMSIDPTGPRVATASLSGDVEIWDVATGARLQWMPHPGEDVRYVAFSPNGQLVATSNTEGVQRIWNAKTGGFMVKLPATSSVAPWIEFDRTSHLLVSGGPVVTVSASDTGLPIAVLEGSKVGTTSVTFDPVARRIAGVLQDGTVQVWDATAQYRRWVSPPVSVDCGTPISLQEDHRFLAIGCEKHGTHVWDTAKDLLLADLPAPTSSEPGAGVYPAVSGGGDRAALANRNTVEIYPLSEDPAPRNLKPVRVVRHQAVVNAMAYARSGHDLVSASRDGQLLVTRDDQEPVELPKFVGGVDTVGFVPDGRVIAAGTNGQLRMYDPISANQVLSVDIGFRARSFRLSSNGRRMLIIPSFAKQSNAQPILWDLVNNRVVSRLDSHKNKIVAGRFTQGDREVITTGGDGVARRWNAETGALLKAYSDSPGLQLDATMSPNGLLVITAGSDGLLRFFDVANGRLLWSLRAHSRVNGLHFEGDQLVTRGFDGDLARWEIPKQAAAPGQAVRCLPLRFDEGPASFLEQSCDTP
ncbi:MAG TPA: WD40 repeat domain-containing protein, partial [Kofleriaceae bacterium]|nr:WD40 repeat domain-containing protein [Kofleriaceae bacterium]